MTDSGDRIFPLNSDGKRAFDAAFAHTKMWCETHQWAIGLSEIALGAALVAAGLNNGAIQMGVDVVATAFSDDLTSKAIGGIGGAALGALPGILLGSIGIAGAGTAVAIPALLLIGGGALLLSLAGYGAGALVEQFLHPVPRLAELATSASLVMVGVALIVDGARRLTKDPKVLQLKTNFAAGVLRLSRKQFANVIDSIEKLQQYYDSEFKPFLDELRRNPTSAAATTALAAIGIAGGQAAAVGSVTVLGSSSIGAVGLSLGLVSAPLWPVLAGGGLALAVAYGVWKATARSGKTSAPAHQQLLLGHDKPTVLSLTYDGPKGPTNLLQ